jgi:hypothetical protein
VTTYVITSSLSLARVLWWYGEDGLWPRARALEPSAVADLAEEFARYLDPGRLAEIWPDAPRHAHLVLPVIELFEGRPRPAARRRRRPEKHMPAELVASEEERSAAASEVQRIIWARQAS